LGMCCRPLDPLIPISSTRSKPWGERIEAERGEVRSG
jgi:hypothetical protein